VRKADKLTTILCAVVMKSGNLNFLEPSGPLQACNGTDSPFIIINYQHVSIVFAILFRVDVQEC
jgi:hypothetical protein